MALFLGVPETLSIAEWKERFKWNFDKGGKVNSAGYGPETPFVPPLQNPQTIYSFQERRNELLATGNIWVTVWWAALPFLIFWNGIGTGDSWDLYWYNNAEAEGSQVYPHGIHKYYDVYSFSGYVNYFIDYQIASILAPFEYVFLWGIPLEVLLAAFTASWENWYLFFVFRWMPWVPFSYWLYPLINWQLERGFTVG